MEETGPVVIHRTLDRTGATYALAPMSRRYLERVLGRPLRLGFRVFISSETLGGGGRGGKLRVWMV